MACGMFAPLIKMAFKSCTRIENMKVRSRSQHNLSPGLPPCCESALDRNYVILYTFPEATGGFSFTLDARIFSIADMLSVSFFSLETLE
jgi:hypothetical protein